MRTVSLEPRRGLPITLAFGLVVLVGCSATASEMDASGSAALTAAPTPNGGVLACSAQHADGANVVRSVMLFTNDDDEGTIKIDRVLVYGRDGQVACTIPNPMVLGPHQMGSLLTANLAWCLPQGPGGGAGKVRLVVHWSREGNKLGTANPLDGWSDITNYDASGGMLTRIARECRAITLPPDKCAGVTCRTESICGQQAQCEVCVEGKCVPNMPHFDASCTPSCGSANALCGLAGICGAANVESHPGTRAGSRPGGTAT
jgi:hypothetical protein